MFSAVLHLSFPDGSKYSTNLGVFSSYEEAEISAETFVDSLDENPTNSNLIVKKVKYAY